MSEPGFSDYIGLNYAMNHTLVCALVGAGVLDPSDIAGACRSTAETVSNEVVESHLLALAERWEAAQAGAERPLAPGWTPEVIAGGKDEGEDGGDASD